jgi:hypothetical protein
MPVAVVQEAWLRLGRTGGGAAARQPSASPGAGWRLRGAHCGERRRQPVVSRPPEQLTVIGSYNLF